jgi:hypothetical protein
MMNTSTLKRLSPYVLGSIWKRRDGKQAVIICEGNGHQAHAVVANEGAELPYVIYADTGHVSKGKQNNPMDLIYRDEP